MNAVKPNPYDTDTNYCAFHKHANCKVQKPPSQLRFSLPSIIITITSNEPWNTDTHKTDRNPPITNHKSQTLTFWTRQSKFLFPKRFVKMIDGSEKRNRQLAFELQNSHVCEKRSKGTVSALQSCSERDWMSSASWYLFSEQQNFLK